MAYAQPRSMPSRSKWTLAFSVLARTIGPPSCAQRCWEGRAILASFYAPKLDSGDPILLIYLAIELRASKTHEQLELLMATV